MGADIGRFLRFLRSYVCNKLRRMSRRVSFDSPRLQLMESKWVRNTREKQCCLSPSSCDVEEGGGTEDDFLLSLSCRVVLDVLSQKSERSHTRRYVRMA